MPLATFPFFLTTGVFWKMVLLWSWCASLKWCGKWLAPPFGLRTALLLYVGHATVEPGSLPPCPEAAVSQQALHRFGSSLLFSSELCFCLFWCLPLLASCLWGSHRLVLSLRSDIKVCANLGFRPPEAIGLFRLNPYAQSWYISCIICVA